MEGKGNGTLLGWVGDGWDDAGTEWDERKRKTEPKYEVKVKLKEKL